MKSIVFSKSFFEINNYNKILKNLTYSKNGIKRICYHKNKNSKFHLMLIDATNEFSYPKHSHLNSDELITLVKGKLKIQLFTKKKIIKVLTKKNNQLFVPKNMPHTTKPLTKNCIYLEFKQGPFRKKNTKFFKNNY